jgi:hypothetical protein
MTEVQAGEADSALGRVEAARERATHPDAGVTPSMETEVQNALLVLKRSDCRPELLERVERISTSLFVMAMAQVNGRPNLYNSQRLRLKKI